MGNINCMSTVVCDIGTGFFKVGFAGDNFPRATFPTIVGRPILRSMRGAQKTATLDKLQLNSDVVVGDICINSEGSLDTVFPVRNGIIQDEENMKHIWNYAFHDVLGCNPDEENNILLTEAVNNPLPNRVLLLKTVFEDYNFERAKIMHQAILSLFAQGLDTGMVVDAGDGVSHVMPVYNGYLISSSVRRLDIAGNQITKRLIDLLQLGGYYLNSSADEVTARKIKEECCFVSRDRKEMEKLEEETTFLRTEYKLQNGERVILEKERYLAPECLFRPYQVG